MVGQMVTWICLDFGDPYLYFDMDRFQTFQEPHHIQIWSFCKKKSPENDLKPGDFKNMLQIKTTTTDY